MPRLEQTFGSDLGAGGADAVATAATAQLGCDSLFAAAREPILILDAANSQVIEANPSAVAHLRTSLAELIGAPLVSVFDPRSAALIEASIARAELRGGTHALSIPGLAGRPALCVRVSVFRAGNKSYFLMRMNDVDPFVVAPVGSDSATFQLIDESPLGFLLTDVNLRIDYANRAFIAMAGLNSRAEVCGKPLTRWLDLTVAELGALQSQLCQRQAVSRLTSSLRGSFKGVRQVEVHAIAVPDDKDPCWGFSVNVFRFLN